MRQKNSYYIYLIIISCLVLFNDPSVSWAKVTGNCSNCHTMHASQNGTVDDAKNPINYGEDSSLPNPALTKADCIGCHSNTEDSDTIKYIGGTKQQYESGVPGISRIPIVYNTVEPAKPLAGGNFYYGGNLFQ